MAKFNSEIPYDLLKQIGDLSDGGADEMMTEMVEESADFVYSEIKKNMRKAFKSTKSLEGGLFISKVKRFNDEDGKVYVFVGFNGYVKGSAKTRRHPKGTPIALIAMAREYGTSRGEAKRPFVRTAFKKSKITQIMQNVQKKYIPED